MTAIERHVFAPDDGIPNSVLPLLLLRGALPPAERAGAAACRLLERNGWTGTWVYPVFPFWHFHMKGHEVLACVSSRALIGFGGDGGIKARLEPGDACLIPAGVGHKAFESSGDFLVAGGYPPGQAGDINKPGVLPEDAARKRLAGLKLPETDPFSGAVGGIVAIWAAAAG